jgi:hypothetical protein
MSFVRRTRTRIVIAASTTEVWGALCDLPSYARWNPVLSIRPWRGQSLRAGGRAWLSLKLFRVPLIVPVLVEVAEPDRELRWIGGPWGLLRGRHYFELHADGDATELVHGEQFEGLLLPLMWPLMEGELDRLYRSINEGLAAYVEIQAP